MHSSNDLCRKLTWPFTVVRFCGPKLAVVDKVTLPVNGLASPGVAALGVASTCCQGSFKGARGMMSAEGASQLKGLDRKVLARCPYLFFSLALLASFVLLAEDVCSTQRGRSRLPHLVSSSSFSTDASQPDISLKREEVEGRQPREEGEGKGESVEGGSLSDSEAAENARYVYCRR